ncbi:hypothetical protein ABH527_001255, partial [Staphylococcus warneri]
HAITEKLEKLNPIYVFLFKKDGVYKIDTIIQSETIKKWPDRNSRKEPNMMKFFREIDSRLDVNDIIKYHLPNFEKDEKNEHNNVTLRSCIGDSSGSYLPLEKMSNQFESFSFPKEYSEVIDSLLRVEKNEGYYIANEFSPRITKDKTKKTNFYNVVNYIKTHVIFNDKLYKLTAPKIDTIYRTIKEDGRKTSSENLSINISLKEL